MRYINHILRSICLLVMLAFACNSYAEIVDIDQVSQRGHELFNTGYYSDALPLIQQAADAGDNNAQYLIGTMYFNGQGVKQDYAIALLWFRKSADQGDKRACFWLGYCNEFGLGVEKNDEIATFWYSKITTLHYTPFSKKEKRWQQTSDTGNRTPNAFGKPDIGGLVGYTLEHWGRPHSYWTGSVTVRVRVNARGKVIEAKVHSGKGEAWSHNEVRRSCEQESLKSAFSVPKNTTQEGVGYITWTFI